MKKTWGPALAPATRKIRASSLWDAHRDHEGLAHRLEVGIDIADGAVERENGRDVQPGGALEVGQTAHRFGQATDPGIGVVLRRHVDDGDRLASGGTERRRGPRYPASG